MPARLLRQYPGAERCVQINFKVKIPAKPPADILLPAPTSVGGVYISAGVYTTPENCWLQLHYRQIRCRKHGIKKCRNIRLSAATYCRSNRADIADAGEMYCWVCTTYKSKVLVYTLIMYNSRILVLNNFEENSDIINTI